ncbi:SURF1 family protein [Nocardioides cynanchi]|uniref:SURF1 family protein n=1 Tax=Nocardioides cynanchi TaxID=2558918 RepID=UPI00124891D5|nr:SURF1 family protein [Nocardioides cynanchi]
MPTAAPASVVRRATAPATWPIHLLALAGIVGCLLLGRWQLHVWQDHRAQSSVAVTRQAPVPLDSVLGPDAAYPDVGLGRPVLVEGTWVPRETVLVTGQQQGGATGTWVVTPVLTSSGSEIPIVRGWVAPSHGVPAPPHGRASLVGLLQPSDDSGPVDDDPHDRTLPALSITGLVPLTGHDLYGGYAIATSRAVPQGQTVSGMTGLTAAQAPHLPGADASTALRNLLYALQWWFFAAFVVFMWWRWLAEDVLPDPGAAAQA